MAKQIRAEGKIHNFPDDATDEEISASLNGMSSAPNKTKGWKGIGEDISKSFDEFPDIAENVLEETPHELNEAAHQPLGRSLKNIAAGNVGVYNLYPEAAQYFGQKAGFNEKDIAKYAPHLDTNKLFGLGEHQAGDTAWQMVGPGFLTHLLTKGLKGVAGAAARSTGAGLTAASQGENPLQGLLLGSILEGLGKTAGLTKQGVGYGVKKLPDLTENLKAGATRVGNATKINKLTAAKEKASDALKAAKEETGNLKYNLTSQGLDTNPAKLQKAINEIPERLAAVGETKSVIPTKEPVNILPRLANDTEREVLPAAEKKAQSAARERARHEMEVANTLDAEKNHGVEYQEEIYRLHHANREAIGAGYKKNEASLDNDKVKIEHGVKEGRDSRAINRDLLEIIAHDSRLPNAGKRLRATSPEAKALLAELDNISKTEEIPAGDYARTARSVKKMAKEEFNKARESGGSITEDQRKVYEDKSKALYEKADEMEQHLIESLGDKYAPLAEERKGLNSRWHKEVRSVDKNKFYNEIRKRAGLSSKSILKKLEGEDLGQQHLRNLTLNNPKALKLALGHAFADTPNGLIKLKPDIQRFVDAHPVLKGLQKGYQDAFNAEQEALLAEHDARLKSEAGAEKNKKNATYYKEDIAREKAEQAKRDADAKVKEENAKIVRQKAAIREEERAMKQAMDYLAKAAANEKLTAAQRMKANRDWHNAAKDLKKIQTVGKHLVTIGSTISGVGYVARIAMSLFK